jgi:hypothetical protein
MLPLPSRGIATAFAANSDQVEDDRLGKRAPWLRWKRLKLVPAGLPHRPMHRDCVMALRASRAVITSAAD